MTNQIIYQINHPTMIKTFSLWNYSLIYWSIQPFIGFYYFVIYWFFSWKISFLSTSIVKCAVVKTIIVYYLGNKDTIYMFCLFYFSIPNFTIIFSRAYRRTCWSMETLSSFMKSPIDILFCYSSLQSNFLTE